MKGYSMQEIAQRAGVDSDYVDRLVGLGILAPDEQGSFSQGDALRARWMQSLDRGGIPLEGIGEVVREGTLSLAFLDAAAFDRFTGLSDTTFRLLSETTGIPLDLLKVLREAVGFAEPRPDDHVREHELSVVPAIQLQLSAGFPPVVIEGWLRVYADSLRRIVETETDSWTKRSGTAPPGGGHGRD